MPEFGYEKFVKKLKDEGKKTYVDEKLPYSVVRGSWKGTFDIITPSGIKVLSTRIVVAGKQLKLLFLRVWTQNPAGAEFVIRQTAQAGDLGSAPAGIVDYPKLEAAGAEVLGPEPLDSPIHVLEGSVNFEVQKASPTPYEYGIAWWGVED